ncbi:MAG: phosphoribosylformylglycinamidine cyclo-ligase [Deltaproteobacteria bacterium]|nr:phosphoribosylformylglycinamidine cyclo-ligase [Deltaproteobacteria bacterium]
MPTTYRESGVDIEAGERFVSQIAALAESTHRPEVIGSLGGFSGLFALRAGQLREPLLVASTDGVGTKLKIAFQAGRHDSVGIDLVAMCVNDLVVCGAEPLFFLDYFATAALDIEQGRQVVAGIAEGCRQAGCALLGGETAEMPGLYASGEYDLAGFAVGLVDRTALLSSERVRGGDVLLGLASSGLHSNGFSLVRKVLDLESAGGEQLDELLIPTRIYVRSCLALRAQLGEDLHALAHITGGGLPGNLPRVLPGNLAVRIDPGSWTVPDVFVRIQSAGGIADQEMMRTFNMGIGMVAVLAPNRLDEALRILGEHGQSACPIGQVIDRADEQAPFVLT